MLVNAGAKIDMTTKLSRKTWYEKVKRLIIYHEYKKDALFVVEAKSLKEIQNFYLSGTKRVARDNFVLIQDNKNELLTQKWMGLFSS